MSLEPARWNRNCANYFSVAVVGSATFLLAMNQLGPGDSFFRGGRWLIMPLFFFFMVAFVPATIVVILDIRERPHSRKKALFCHLAVLPLTFLLQPHLQPYLLPFDLMHAKELETKSLEHEVVGKTEAAAIAFLGKPTFSVDLEALDTKGAQEREASVDHTAKQLRYRHWWFMWDPTEFFMVVEREHVVRTGVKY